MYSVYVITFINHYNNTLTGYYILLWGMGSEKVRQVRHPKFVLFLRSPGPGILLMSYFSPLTGVGE